jgi:hypothetical protein
MVFFSMAIHFGQYYRTLIVQSTEGQPPSPEQHGATPPIALGKAKALHSSHDEQRQTKLKRHQPDKDKARYKRNAPADSRTEEGQPSPEQHGATPAHRLTKGARRPLTRFDS